MRLRLFLLCLLTVFSLVQLHAQDSIRAPVENKNNIKVSVWFTHVSLYYEHAITSKFSVGVKFTTRWYRFNGNVANLYGRYFVKLRNSGGAFNKSGCFVELKATYGHYNIHPVYTSYSYDRTSDTYHYYGEHSYETNYFGGTLSFGYKRYCSKTLFFEFVGGFRYGYAKFGNPDIIFKKNSIAQSFKDVPATKVKGLFYDTGPGCPMDVSIAIGFEF